MDQTGRSPLCCEVLTLKRLCFVGSRLSSACSPDVLCHLRPSPRNDRSPNEKTFVFRNKLKRDRCRYRSILLYWVKGKQRQELDSQNLELLSSILYRHLAVCRRDQLRCTICYRSKNQPMLKTKENNLHFLVRGLITNCRRKVHVFFSHVCFSSFPLVCTD